MYYDMSTISNRDLQVLYEYRILKIPSHELTEILRAMPQEFQITEWAASEKEIDGYDTIYETHFELECGDHVPFLEFLPEDNQDWKWICDFIGIDVSTTSVTLYSATDKITNLRTIIYQNLTLRQIESLLLDILDALAALGNNIDALESDIARITSDNSNIGQRPEGLRNNLLKLQVSEDETKIVDAGVYIKKSELSRLYANPSQTDLNGLLPAYKQAVDLRLITKTRHVVQNITAPRIQISGNGDLIIRNLKGQVIITKWTGTVTIIDCSEVHLQATSMQNRCFLEQLRISRNSTVYLENYPHEIDSLVMLLSSTVRHWNGYVKSLDFVGPGCTYWCSQFVALPGSTKLPTPGTISAAVMDFRLKDIYGILSREIDKLLIINQKQVQNQVANADPPVQPYECLMNYKVDGGGVAPGPSNPGTPGGGVEGDINEVTIEGVSGFLWIPKSSANLGLIVAMPGYNTGRAEATTNFGAYMVLDILKPNALVFIPIRTAQNTIPSGMRNAIAKIQTDYSLNTADIWFYGFSQGACDFSTMSSWYNWKGAVLVDGNYPYNITIPSALTKVMIVQGMLNYAQAYSSVFTNAGITPTVYDYYGQASHANVNYWTPSDSDATYQQIAGQSYYKKLPSDPPNGLLWLLS